MSPELIALTRRAEVALRRHADLAEENARLRNAVTLQLQHMHDMSRAFLPRGPIRYPGASPSGPPAASSAGSLASR